MHIVFMGSPEFALPSLQALIDSEHTVVGVFTQPDKPTGRGRKLAPPPVKALAESHNIPVFQPRSISSPRSVEQLRELQPDIGVIAAYGQILKQPVLDLPRLGVLNVHASLLPRWRGAAPIPAAILAGDTETGATIMQVVLALDAGPMLATKRVPIDDSDTTATLTPKVAEAGAALLLETLPAYERGPLSAVEQDDALSTYAPQLEKSDGRIDWAAESADQIWRKVRAYNPWPMAYTTIDGQPLRILECLPLEDVSLPAGRVAARNASDDPRIGCRVGATPGAIGVITLQPSGRAAMPADAYVRGRRDLIGATLE